MMRDRALYVHFMNGIVRSMSIDRRPVFSPLPLFRSAAQYRVVGELYTNVGRQFTISQLADRAQTSHPTVSREVARLAEAALVRTWREGNRTLVTANAETPIFENLRDLMVKVYGPVPILEEELAGLASNALIFGSWAARSAGERGSVPADIDVLVIGDADPLRVWEGAARASRRLGMEVNALVRTEQEWVADEGGFASEVRRRPVIELDLGQAGTFDEERLSSAASRWG